MHGPKSVKVVSIVAEIANTAWKQFQFSSDFPMQLQTQPDILNSYRYAHSMLYTLAA